MRGIEIRGSNPYLSIIKRFQTSFCGYEYLNQEREELRKIEMNFLLRIPPWRDTKYAKVFNIFGWIVLQIFPFIGSLEPSERFEHLEPLELLSILS